MKSRLPALFCALVLGCGGDADFTPVEQPASWTETAGARWRALALEPTDDVGFTAVPATWSGITFANALSDESLVESQVRAHGSGVAMGDFDADGRVDVFFTRLDGTNVLYRNAGGWRFEDVTEGSGVAGAEQFSTGAAFADVDGDRDLDLFVLSIGGGKTLYLNDGSGRFEDAGLALGAPSGAMSLALADIDGDTDLDLYLVNYKLRPLLETLSPEERSFANTLRQTDDGLEVLESFTPFYEILERSDRVQRVEKGEADELYINDGTGKFRNASGAMFTDAAGARFDELPSDWGFSARFADLDGDRDPDLYVANDFHTPDRLWINDGSGGFREASTDRLQTTSASSMAIDVSDVERDGDVDIFVADMLSRSSQLRKTQEPLPWFDLISESGAPATQQVARNTLLVNRGDDTYEDVANYAGVEASDWSWSSLFVDVDLDGYEDLLIPNGHIRDLTDTDAQIGLRDQVLDDWREAILFYDPLPLSNVAYRNLGELRFEEVGSEWGFGSGPDISHGAALGDLDGDGDLDAVVNRLGEPALVLRNDADASRLAVRLIGAGLNTHGIGATIYVDAPGLPRQSKEIAAGGGYLSGSETLAVFAMGAATDARIEVAWRGGARSVVAVDGPNRLYEIAEPMDSGETDPAGGSIDAPSATPEGPWFRIDETFIAGHVEFPFDELTRQPLLPNSLGHMGPSLAWHDLDADGDPDLIISGASGSPPTLLRNDDGAFVPVVASGPRAPVDQTGLIPLPDGLGRTRVIVGLSNYEAPTTDGQAVPGAIGLEWDASAFANDLLEARAVGLVPGDQAATGPVAVSDYDGDGLLDLFLGGRVLPGRYPELAGSRLFRGRPGGQFQPDPQPALRTIGLVSGALFSDVDVDGDQDLVLATDWGPIRILRNDGGRYTDATEAFGLSDRTSRWNAIASGDFDGDGRPDLVATSWGENTKYRATPTRPLEVYFEDFDRNGTLDIVEAQLDDRIGGVAPLSRLTRLGPAIPSLLERNDTHADYANQTVEEAFGRVPAGHTSINTLSHTVFLNRGDRFEAHPLPAQAQWSPSLGVAVADANGDGAEDIFLAQNFFPTDETSQRYLSGRGMWLQGDGRGDFTPVSPARSGIALKGDQRGVAVADVDGDGRIDLAVGQNGGPVRLFRNVGGAPGLRVRVTGSAANPFGIGTSLRIAYGEARGPLREIRAGSGTGSHDDPVQVLGLSDVPTGVEVRWPGGGVDLIALEPGQTELSISSSTDP